MSCIKGLIVGITIGTAIGVMYSEGMMNKNKILKQSKKVAKKLGLV